MIIRWPFISKNVARTNGRPSVLVRKSQKKIVCKRLVSPMRNHLCFQFTFLPLFSINDGSIIFKIPVSVSIPQGRILYSYICIPPSHRLIIGVKLFLSPFLLNFLSLFLTVNIAARIALGRRFEQRCANERTFVRFSKNKADLMHYGPEKRKIQIK